MPAIRHTYLLLFSLLLVTGCATTRIDRLPELQTGTASQPFELRGVLQQNLLLGGVIRLTGDLLIPAGRILQIAPGSHLLVVGNDSTKIDPEFLDKGTELLVKGRLLVAGQPGQRVTISLDESTPTGENWAGIELVTADAAIFEHVDILGAEIGILSLNSSPQLTDVNILGSRFGLLLQGDGQLTYRGGRISGGDAGLLCFDRSALELSQLQILDNQEEGLYLAAGCTLKPHELQIARNDLGVVASEPYRAALLPQLHDNRVDFKPLPAEALP